MLQLAHISGFLEGLGHAELLEDLIHGNYLLVMANHLYFYLPL